MKTSEKSKKNIVICAALPYANGSLHLGHVAGLIGSDILARYFRMKKHPVLFVSGSDCHGTPIVFEAEKQSTTPHKIAEKYHQEFVDTLIKGMNFSYDFYTKTTSKVHQELVQEIFLVLYEKGYIYKKTEKLPYCENCSKFLPDRYIEGQCYLCAFESARGDQCDGCGNLMNTNNIINPQCKFCKETPLWKDSEHFFLKLSAFEEDLKKWVKESSGWKTNAKNFTLKFLANGLHDRSITRDVSWGIPIPLPGYESKNIYVWFEAVCAYLSASKEWAQKINQPNEWKKF
jgi:methionyl-tRNA synthetase